MHWSAEQYMADYEYDDNTIHVLLWCMGAVGYREVSKKAKSRKVLLTSTV